MSDAPTDAPATPPTPTYTVACQSCAHRFDAMEADWCSCLVSERSFVCPKCLQCFCTAPPVYKQRFWREAPKALWDRKFVEQSEAFVPPANPEPGSARRPLVLVVDDEKAILKVAQRVVEELGYGVILARNGEEGLELTRRYHPDLVLTDALMPKLGGRELCLALKSDPATAAIKVVLMTSLYTNVKYQTEGFKAYKVDEYLAKPLELPKLQALLAKHLR